MNIDRTQYAARNEPRIACVITLPWPHKDLSPNARVHWAARSRQVKKHRNWGKESALAAGARGLAWDSASVCVTFHPPARHHYDDDNLLARSKALLDGIADATKIDDSKWSISIKRGEPVKNGLVVVTLQHPIPQEVM